MPLPTSLVVKNGSKIVSSWSGAMPLPVSVTEIAMKSPPRRGLRAQRRDAAAPCARRWSRRPSPSMASRALTARLISAVSNWAMSAIAKQSPIVDISTSIRMRPPTSGRTSCATASTWRADIEDLRLQRLPPGKGQQLPGQLGGALDGVGDRVDIAAAPLFRQFAAAQEIGRRADDGQEVVEVVRDAAGQLADRLHLLRLAQRFLALAALGDVDGLRHRAGDRCRAGRRSGRIAKSK